MLTDEQIRQLLGDCESDKGKPWLVHLWKSDLSAKVVAELCTRVLEAEARVKVLEDALREILDEIGDQNYHEVYAIGRYALEGK